MTNCNVPNRTIFCHDNLDILRGIDSECIDLIYLDPPFNKNKKFTAPIGSSAEGAEFSDIFREEDVKDEWLLTIREDHAGLYHYLNGIKGVGNRYNFAYLAYMAIRLLECWRVLKASGSIYLHCDTKMSHYLKTVMDCVFGEDNFKNEIVWGYKTGGVPRESGRFARKHELLLFFGKEKDKTTFNTLDEISYTRTLPEPHTKSGKELGVLRDSIGKYRNVAMRDWWVEYGLNAEADITPLYRNNQERTGYPTQKPLALLDRIIRASSNKGDIVFDPFCGCATTCVAAERLQRHWIGVDVSVKSYELVKERLSQEAADPSDLFKYQNQIYIKTTPPKRTDQEVDYRERKFVYVISHPAYPGEYKVGLARNWKSRLNAYQTLDSDRRYRVEYKVETTDFREIEKYIHDVFPNKHEWVQADLKDITKTIKQYNKGK
ncbi:MAG: DNA methyltransferase [Gammaproteobacteria bacterium]|nr:DNA methyltransferase [Gammaproteobacteria bacterium]